LGDKTVSLRSFDAATLEPLGTKLINVSATDVTRIVVCGEDRLCFRAGKEIYIVRVPPPGFGSVAPPH
jgi:hypothetical protein